MHEVKSFQKKTHKFDTGVRVLNDGHLQNFIPWNALNVRNYIVTFLCFNMPLCRLSLDEAKITIIQNLEGRNMSGPYTANFLQSSKIFVDLTKNGFTLTMVFCCQNCSDPLWEKIVLISDREKHLKFEVEGSKFANFFKITRTIYSNIERSEQFLVKFIYSERATEYINFIRILL